MSSTPTPYAFDDRNIHWQTLGDFEHFLFTVLDVDEEKKLVDALVKYEPNEKIFLHRHLAQTNTLVVQGEHRFYESDGSLREARPAGTYTITAADTTPHSEGGGADGAVVLYSLRAEQDCLFEILDEGLNVVGTLSLQDFLDANQAQKQMV